MRTLTTLLTTGVLLVGLSGIAQATTLYAGPMRVDGGFITECALLNVGKNDIKNVTIENTIAGEGVDQFSAALVAPGETFTSTNFNSLGGDVLSWCKFVYQGGKKSVRATFCVLDADGNCRAAVPAQ